jgi:hypothetical protein
MTPQQALYDLLPQLFGVGDLRRLIEYDPHLAVIAKDLPEGNPSRSDFATTVIERLQQHGLLAEFFALLKQERPRRVTEIEQVENLWPSATRPQHAPAAGTPITRTDLLSRLTRHQPPPSDVLRGITGKRIDLAPLYVPLQLEDVDRPVHHEPECSSNTPLQPHSHKHEETEVNSWHESASDTSIILVGEIGSGKTELLLRRYRDALKLAEADPTRPLPLWLPVSRLPASFDIHDLHRQLHFTADEFTQLIRSEQATFLIFLDGYDEAPARAQQILDITQDALGRCLRRVEVSTRPGFAPRVPRAKTVKISPWTDDQSALFQQLWAEHIDPAAVRALRASPSYDRLRTNLTNPLFASLCAHIAASRPECLRSRTAIFRAVLDLAFHRWAPDRVTDPRAPLRSPNEILDLLQPLALAAIRGEEPILKGPELRKAILKNEDFPTPTEDLLRGYYGVIAPVEGGDYIFTIRGLAEYLAGRALLSGDQEQLVRASRESWGVEPVRHALALRHAADPNDAHQLLARLIRDEGEDDIAVVNGHLRPVMIAALAASDLAPEIPADLTATIVNAVLRRVTEETTSWVGEVMLQVVRSFIRADHELARQIRARMVATALDHSSPRSHWFETAEALSVNDLLNALAERDPAVRSAVCRRLRAHVDIPEVQQALWSQIFDGQDDGPTLPSIAAGLTLHHATRGPAFEPTLKRLTDTAANGDQLASFSASLALLPGEAPHEVLIAAFQNGFQAAYYIPEVISALAAAPDGEHALDKHWPKWRDPPPNHAEQAPPQPTAQRAAPPPSWSTRSRIAETLAITLDLIEPAQLEALLQDPEIRHSLAHEAMRFPERALETVLPAFLAGATLCRRGRAAIHELGRNNDLAAEIVLRSLRGCLTEPGTAARYFPGRAVEGLILRGNTEALSLYARWLVGSPYSRTEHVNDSTIPPEILRLEPIAAVFAKVKSDYSDRSAIHWHSGVIARFTTLWQDDAATWAQIKRALTPWGSNLSRFFKMTINARLPADVESRLVEVLEEFLARHNAPPNHPEERDYWHQGARDIAPYIFFKSHPTSLAPILLKLAGRDVPPICRALALHASIAAIPLLTPAERSRLSAQRAQHFASNPESLANAPQHETLAFIGAAPEPWFEAFAALIVKLPTRPHFAEPLKTLLGVFPTDQRQRAAALWRDHTRNQELPWHETRWPDGYARLADDARQLLFESGGRLDTRAEHDARQSGKT